ncbi:MAG TPA: MerR family transcriptional regulator [Actinomycetota bacterium]|jgi:DNA-binding transcriptional MerR regulator|nr:MerR family transcriptional regulator [Actinomycetota bacterium]
MREPERYLRIGELARRTGTSPELLRAWEQRYGLLRPTRSEGGFRLYSDQDEDRVLRTKTLIAEGLSAAEAARRALGSEEPTEEAEEAFAAEGLATEFRETLDRFDEDGANRAFDRLLAAFSLETVMQQVLLPYLHLLGARWASGEISVAQEHFASSLIRGRLLGLARGWGTGRARSLLLACPPGEEHDLGLIMFGIAAWRRGWRVTYLGQDTPFGTIEEAAADVKPALVVLAVAEGTPIAPFRDELRRLADRVPIAVGGGINADDVSGLGLRVLEGDPIEAARSVVA